MKTLFLDMFLLLLIFISIKEASYRKLYRNKDQILKENMNLEHNIVYGNKLESLKSLKLMKKINILKNFSNITRNKNFYEDRIFNTEEPYYYKDSNKFVRILFKLKSVFYLNNSYNIEENKYLPQTPIISILAFLGISLSSYGFENYIYEMLSLFIFYFILIYIIWYFKNIKIITFITKNLLMLMPVIFSSILMMNNYSSTYKNMTALNSILTSYINYIFLSFIISIIIYVFANLIIIIYNLLFHKKLFSSILSLELFYTILYIMIMTM